MEVRGSGIDELMAFRPDKPQDRTRSPIDHFKTGYKPSLSEGQTDFVKLKTTGKNR